ncbi:MAG TPA: hypothetical protein VMZ00_09065 [Sporichthya sp.]|nr:hypothetical protein [Sporichthya sp.]
MTPLTLTLCAVLAAATAAAIGHHYSPARRARRKQAAEQARVLRRHQAITRQVQINVAGRIAVHTAESVWLDLLAQHTELYSDQRGGAA